MWKSAGSNDNFKHAIATTTNTKNAKFLKHYSPPFASRRSDRGFIEPTLSRWKIVSNAVRSLTAFLTSSGCGPQHYWSLVAFLDLGHPRFRDEFRFHYPCWCYKGQEIPQREPVAEFKSTAFLPYIQGVSRSVLALTYNNKEAFAPSSSPTKFAKRLKLNLKQKCLYSMQ